MVIFFLYRHIPSTFTAKWFSGFRYECVYNISSKAKGSMLYFPCGSDHLGFLIDKKKVKYYSCAVRSSIKYLVSEKIYFFICPLSSILKLCSVLAAILDFRNDAKHSFCKGFPKEHSSKVLSILMVQLF